MGGETWEPWSMSGEFTYRHHEELRLKLYDTENETFPIHWNASTQWDKLTRVYTMSLNILPMVYGPKRRRSVFMRSGLGAQDSRSFVQGFLKDTRGWLEDLRRSKRPPARPHMAWSLDTIIQEDRKKTYCRMGRIKCQTASSTPQHGNLRGVDRRQGWLQGDCWRSSENRKRHCSCFALHWEEWQPRENFRQL